MSVKTGRPSSTARLVAEGVLLVAHEPGARGIVSDEARRFAQSFSVSWGRGPVFFWLFSQGLFRRVVWALEKLLIPGIILHYAVRKKYIEDLAIGAISNGVRQVVVLGAGFDSLAARLSEKFGTVLFIEIDHPSTQALKLQALQALLADRSNLRFDSADLSKGDLKDVLLRAGCSPELPTLYIAEGLLMYFSPERVMNLFRELSLFAKPHSESKFIFSFMERQKSGRIGFRSFRALVDFWLSLKNEPFTWGIKKEEAELFLKTCSWRMLELADDRLFRSRYLVGGALSTAPLAKGEVYCLATVGAILD